MHTPSHWIFIVSVILVVAAIVGALHILPAIAAYDVYLAIAGWLVLTIGVFVKTT